MGNSAEYIYTAEESLAKMERVIPVEQALFDQFVAQEVKKTGFGTVRVRIREAQLGQDPTLRRVEYFTDDDTPMTWIVFEAGINVTPEDGTWKEEERQEAAITRINEFVSWTTRR